MILFLNCGSRQIKYICLVGSSCTVLQCVVNVRLLFTFRFEHVQNTMAGYFSHVPSPYSINANGIPMTPPNIDFFNHMGSNSCGKCVWFYKTTNFFPWTNIFLIISWLSEAFFAKSQGRYVLTVIFLFLLCFFFRRRCVVHLVFHNYFLVSRFTWSCSVSAVVSVPVCPTCVFRWDSPSWSYKYCVVIVIIHASSISSNTSARNEHRKTKLYSHWKKKIASLMRETLTDFKPSDIKIM